MVNTRGPGRAGSSQPHTGRGPLAGLAGGALLAAIAQLRTLLSHAGSVADLLSVQNQINAEESSLEQMQAQQRVLSHQTSYATVTLTTMGPAAPERATRRDRAPSA